MHHILNHRHSAKINPPRNKRIFLATITVALFVVIGSGIIFSNYFNSNPQSSASVLQPADINNDNKVDIADLSLLIGKWNTNDTLSDLNKDGAVNIFDLSMLISRWGNVVISPRTISPGAKLPISYDMSALPGTKRYVATNGNDTTGDGSLARPYATIKKAEAVSLDGDTIVVRGGTYPIASNAVTIDRARLTIAAYTGEIPVFDGSIAAPTIANTEGALKYFSYTPVPAGLGEGVLLSNLPSATFSGTTPTGQAAERGWRCVTGDTTYVLPGAVTSSDPDGCGSNPAKVITGYYPDQVWVNGVALKQVLDKSKVVAGTFWVDRASATDAAPTSTNLYVSSVDAADMSKVRVSSSRGTFMLFSASNIIVKGIKIINNSPTWSQATVLLNNNSTTLENVSIESCASGALKIARGSTAGNFATGNTLRNVTVTNSGWTGAVLYYNDNTTLDGVLFSNNERDKEFYNSPQRGAIKATKSHRTKIINSAFENNTIGVWFDQSNYNTDIANNRFAGNSDSSVFYEISHGLTLVNNYIDGRFTNAATIRLAGASALKFVNNTIIGGKDVIWIGTDARSKTFVAPTGETRDCSEYTLRYNQGGDGVADCWVSYSSDFDKGRPGAYSPTGAPNMTPGMNWRNSIDVFVNNIVANSTGSNQCGAVVPVCINGYINWNSSLGLIKQQVPLNEIFHPSIIMNGNLYQSNSGRIVYVRGDTSVSQPGGFSAADVQFLRGSSGLGSAYYGLSVEANGLSAATGLVDDQGVTATSVNHANAAPVPVDPSINAYIPAGTKHYGIVGN